MSVVFRVDASLASGAGHVMRCLTLAEELRRRDVDCVFVSRPHRGNLIDFIRQRGFETRSIGEEETDSRGCPCRPSGTEPTHAAWLGADWEADAEETEAIVRPMCVDWIVVDHYALDARWEGRVRGLCKKLLVIDDLADRPHACDLLVDQNLGRTSTHYDDLLRSRCAVLTGPRYALIRPEFAMRRAQSLARRREASLGSILIGFGGIDYQNVTGAALEALRNCRLAAETRVTVAMGAGAPWTTMAREKAAGMRWQTNVVEDVKDMAGLMASADLAVGAAGTSVWERCCMGLPSVIVIQAENQRHGATALEAAGAVLLAPDVGRLALDLPRLLEGLERPILALLQKVSADLVDGMGVTRVLDAMWCVDA